MKVLVLLSIFGLAVAEPLVAEVRALNQLEKNSEKRDVCARI
jgi:hypothetical protein